MRLIKKEKTWYRTNFKIFGIKISIKRKLPSQINLSKRIKALKNFFYSKVGYPLDIVNPQTFNEKINWLKLFYHNDLMTRIVDKYEFKNYIKEQLGSGYTVPLLGVWGNVDDIDFDKLPEKFVLKCNAQSDSKFIKIVKNKNELDIEALKDEMKEWLKPEKTLKTSYCWAYYNVPLRIIAEEYIEQIDGQVYDYKFMCFNGEPKLVLACKDRGRDTIYENHNMDWSLIIPSPNSAIRTRIERPNNYEEMVKIAKKLSAPFPFVRVDFYEIENAVLLGEMTFYPNGGYNTYYREYDKEFGNYIELPDIKVKPSFFEIVQYDSKHIIQIAGKKVLTYHKPLSKKELTKKLEYTNDLLKFTNSNLKTIKNEVIDITNELQVLKDELNSIKNTKKCLK